MPNVLIRNLPAAVHSTLVTRAEREGQSLQQFLTTELTRLAHRPTAADVFAALDATSRGAMVDPEEIVSAIHEGRGRSR